MIDGETDVNAKRLQYLRDNARAVAAWPAWMREGARTPEKSGAMRCSWNATRHEPAMGRPGDCVQDATATLCGYALCAECAKLPEWIDRKEPAPLPAKKARTRRS